MAHPPSALPGRVIRDNDLEVPGEVVVQLSFDQAAKRAPDGEGLLWTTDLFEELPVLLHKSGIGAAPPVTLVETFAATVREHSDHVALAYKPSAECKSYRTFTWLAYWNEVCRFAKALISVGHQSRECVVIMGHNSPMWLIGHFGAIFASGISASIYPTTGPEATEFIVQHSSAIVAVVDSVENMKKLVAAKVSGNCPTLLHIVMYMEEVPDGFESQRVWHWEEFMKLGHTVSDLTLTERMESQKPGMCCELVYTSGTTGRPKGVMLSHDNCVWNAFSLTQAMAALSAGIADPTQLDKFMPQHFIGVGSGGASTIPTSSGMNDLPSKYKPHIFKRILQSLLPVSLSPGQTSVQMSPFNKDDRGVSYLPLSHIAPQITDIYVPLVTGCTVYFAQPDALRGSLVVTLREVRPTFFFAVPRVYEKMEERIRAVGAQNRGLKKRIGEWAKSVGLRGTLAILNDEPMPFGYSLAHSLILKRVQQALGLDQCRCFGSGAAPLTPATRDYFISLGIPICDMYGMSECAGPQTSCAPCPGWFKRKTAGIPLPGTEMMIDRPSADGIGEVCFRSRNRFMGYFKDKANTKATIDSNGFLHSGDIGFIDNDGFLSITGRIKEILITAGGENVPPVPIEDNVRACLQPVVSNCMVVGDGRKFLSMLICVKAAVDSETRPTNVLDEGLIKLLKEKGSASRTIYEASQDPIVASIIEEGIKEANSKALSRAQYVQRFRIVPQEFTQEGGELTPTLKLRRTFVLKKYESLVEEMYADGNLAPASKSSVRSRL